MSKEPDDKGSRSIRALEILEAVTQAERGLSAAEVAEVTGLPKATVHRLLAMLQRERFLVKDIGGSGLIGGSRLTQLAHSVMAGSGARAVRHRVLSELAATIGETCNITVPDGSEMIYFDRAESKWPLRMQLPVGSRVPLHCTATGKLYLSWLPAAQRRDLLGRLDLKRYTANTICDRDALESSLRDIRASGIGIDNEEFLEGMIAVAVPVLDQRNRLCACLATHGPSVRLTIEAALTHIPALRDAASSLLSIESEPESE